MAWEIDALCPFELVIPITAVQKENGLESQAGFPWAFMQTFLYSSEHKA